jgi:site-specific recombinase XerD
MNNEFYISKYVRPFFEDYLVCRKNLSICTIRSYRDVMKMFLNFAAGRSKKTTPKLLISDVEESMVLKFLTHLEEKRSNSIQTRNHRLAMLRKFFEYISYQEPVWSELCRKILDIPIKRGAIDPEICYLEKAEITAIFDAIDIGTTRGRRDYAVLLFMYNSGARVQETSDLLRSWLSLEEPYKVQILGKGRKSRTCPLWRNTVEVLKKLIADRPEPMEEYDHIFLNRMGKPLSRFGICDIIKKYKSRAITRMPSLTSKKVTPHTIRHTTAMHLLQSGVEINVIRSWLGHAQLITTHRYAEIDLAMKRKALKSCEVKNRRTSRGRWHSDPDVLSWLESL